MNARGEVIGINTAIDQEAEGIGFAGVMAGPLVRSSYRAGRLYAQAMAHRGAEVPASLAHLAAEGPAHQEITSVLGRTS